MASLNDHTEVVKLLISVSNPKDQNSEALCWDSNKNNVELFGLLYPLLESKKALKYMKGEDWSTVLLEENLKI